MQAQHIQYVVEIPFHTDTYESAPKLIGISANTSFVLPSDTEYTAPGSVGNHKFWLELAFQIRTEFSFG